MTGCLTRWNTSCSWAVSSTLIRQVGPAHFSLKPHPPPPQGVLDLLANRCLAQGTNAWTDVDHTCYTMTTAGSQGFLNLLPVYLEHILYPTLTVSLE